MYLLLEKQEDVSTQFVIEYIGGSARKYYKSSSVHWVICGWVFHPKSENLKNLHVSGFVTHFLFRETWFNPCGRLTLHFIIRVKKEGIQQ